MMLKNCEDGKDNWVSKVKNVLCENGFGIVWLSQSVNDENHVLSELKFKLTDIFFQTWNSKMSNNPNYSFYFSFKSFITPEYYLKSNTISTRITVFDKKRFRCGVSKRNAHRYRYYTDESLKIRPFCTNMIEDEIRSIFFGPSSLTTE